MLIKSSWLYSSSGVGSLTKQIRVSAGKGWGIVGSLNLVIDKSMPRLFSFTRTLPEVDSIFVILA